MARRPNYPPLNIFLNSRHVGVLRRQPSGAIDFTYNHGWLAWEHAMPISLSLPLREDRYIGAPVGAVFDNLLPDNEAIRRKVAAKVGAEGIDPYSLLAAVGRDCVGAMQFLLDGAEPERAGRVDGKPVSDDQIAAILSNLESAPLGLDEDEDFRISVTGAQEKTALLNLNGQWFKPLGTTPTTHIFKPQIGQLPNGIDLSNSVENEYFCLKLMSRLGLQSACVEMADFGGRRVLIVERFDREWTDDGRLLRVPQEDCCQALSIPWTLKYERDGGPGIESLLDLLGGSDDAVRDRESFFKTMIVFWLLGATDGHGKNFSIFLYPGGRYSLTPLYDVLSAQPSVDLGQIKRNRMKLAMAVGDRRHYEIDTIVPRHFVQTAEKAGLGTSFVISIFEHLAANAAKHLEDVLTELPEGFPESVADAIANGFRNRLAVLTGENATGIAGTTL
jgi:serine/threonine-protein kinase HipA